MGIFRVLFGGELDDEVFDSREEAEEYAVECCTLMRQGAAQFHMSNPGDYAEDDYDDEYEIVED